MIGTGVMVMVMVMVQNNDGRALNHARRSDSSSPSVLAHWLYERECFEGTTDLGREVRFTRALPSPAVEVKYGYLCFTDGSSERFVTAIREREYFELELQV